jgi:hypothetical protein
LFVKALKEIGGGNLHKGAAVVDKFIAMAHHSSRYEDGGTVEDDETDDASESDGADDDASGSGSADSDAALRHLESVSDKMKKKYGPRLILDKLDPDDRHALDEAWHELVMSS